MLCGDSFQKHNARAGLIWLWGNGLDWYLGTTSFESGCFWCSGVAGGLWRAPINEWLDSAHKGVLLIGFLFFDLEVELVGFKLHEGDIAELVDIVNWWCFFELHILQYRYGFYFFKKRYTKIQPIIIQIYLWVYQWKL